jgi:hypothetical protein
MRGNAVYTRTVTTEEGPLLSESMHKWVEAHRVGPKISAYAYDKDGIYELILVDNRNGRENQYLRTDVKIRQWRNKLYLEFADTQAISENDIKYNQETYLILKEQPAIIKLTVNGDEEILIPETGSEPITQP